MKALVKTLARFGLVGGVVTAVVYLAFIGLLRLGVHYLVAATAGWAIGVGLSYGLNRSFTFAVETRANPRELGAFVGGYLLQLGLGLAAYGMLIGVLGFNPTLAFLVNLGLTSTFSFAFMRWVVFHRVRVGNG
jgi:putative flippase GtrA